MLSINYSIKNDRYKLFLVYKLKILQITTIGLIHINYNYRDDKTFNNHNN